MLLAIPTRGRRGRRASWSTSELATGGSRLPRARASTSRSPGWVEHDADEIWETRRSRAAAALADAGVAPARAARDRHHEPARDDGPLGARDRRPVAPAIVWQDRRTARALRASCPADWSASAPASSSTRTSRRRRSSGCSRARPAPPRRARVRHGRLVARLEADRRRVHVDGRHERVAHDAARPRARSTWDDELLALFGVAAAVLPAVAAVGGGLGDADAPRRDRADRRRSRATSRPRSSARRASSRARRRPPTARAASSSSTREPSARRRRDGLLADASPGAARRRAAVRAGGLGVRRRRRAPVAPGRARADRRRGGERGDRAHGPRATTASYFVPALTGLGAPHWDAGGARPDHRPHTWYDARASRPRGARGDRVPDGRRARGDGRAQLELVRADGGASANGFLSSCRPICSGAGRGAGRARDHGARRGGAGRASARSLAGHGRARRHLATRRAVRATARRGGGRPARRGLGGTRWRGRSSDSGAHVASSRRRSASTSKSAAGQRVELLEVLQEELVDGPAGVPLVVGGHDEPRRGRRSSTVASASA